MTRLRPTREPNELKAILLKALFTLSVKTLVSRAFLVSLINAANFSLYAEKFVRDQKLCLKKR